MAQKIRKALLFLILTVAFFVSLYHRQSRTLLLLPDDVVFVQLPRPLVTDHSHRNTATHHKLTLQSSRRVYSFTTAAASQIPTVSVLLPAWELLVIVSPEFKLSIDPDQYDCLFKHNYTSPATPSGVLPFPDRHTFKCLIPESLRHRSPFPQPLLVPSSQNCLETTSFPELELRRWTYLVYNSLTTERDVVLFVKGVNRRQGASRPPTDFRCVFGDDVSKAVRTAVTSLKQEVIRCQHPHPEAFSLPGGDEEEHRVKVSLEIFEKKRVVPSVAYYTPRYTIPAQERKFEICACTMVYNVAKFLKEWVVYNSKIGVEKFILYDNDSDDNLQEIVKELVEEGLDVDTLFWPWPKAQEAGFSHCALYAKESCRWMMYIDVDEFVYSPKWQESSNASKTMLASLLPSTTSERQPWLGQISIGCLEFGPSDQESHPVMGVVQGYNCRRKMENRHKSIVLLDAVDESLLNAIHHFRLKEGYRGKKLIISKAMVNHYKFQAWPEFKAKFRRRVSTYVKDWTESSNLNSKDRTPGLGFAAVEPKGWPQMFCEVKDNRLKELTRRWFGVESPSGYQMAWQR